MTKHSRNNTANSVFSHYEYKKLAGDYGTKRQRLGYESMRRFDACNLCLQEARDPVTCSHGHLFCKECVYTDLLEQKKDMKRKKERIEALRKEEELERENARVLARERVLRDFERGQLTVSRPESSLDEKDRDASRGVKRKFEIDKDALETTAREAEETALKVIRQEQAEARKAKLPDFWLPSLTPDAKASVLDLKDVKLHTLCNAVLPPHQLLLKNLIAVDFTKDNSTEQPGSKMCPSCKKTISNNTILHLMKACSHVVCKTCYSTFVESSKQCVICDKAGEVIQLNREGTGYSGGGRAETSKSGTAFQG